MYVFVGCHISHKCSSSNKTCCTNYIYMDSKCHLVSCKMKSFMLYIMIDLGENTIYMYSYMLEG